MAHEMTWQAIAAKDQFLAGSIAAREWDWWDEQITAESQADSVGLVGEPRAKFLAGWHYELAEREQERKGQLVEEYDEMGKGYEKGDPAAW